MSRPIGLTGPDMLDVLTMWAMTGRDLNLRIVLQCEPRHVSGIVTGLRLTLRCTPATETGNVWFRWKPMDFTKEWSPENGRTFPATLWHALFELYSCDFPSDWPNLKQASLL